MKKYMYIILLMLPLVACGKKAKAQANSKTETFHVAGNCGMCKKTIESSVDIKEVLKADWDKETKMITVTYDTTKVTIDKIKKKIAEAGYDNDLYKGDDEAYSNLHGCCQYEKEK